MEKVFIIQNLGEAEIQLKETIDKLKNQADYDVAEFQIEIQHLMVHINTAYNLRTWTKEQIENDYGNSFDELIKVPDDNYLID